MTIFRNLRKKITDTPYLIHIIHKFFQNNSQQSCNLMSAQALSPAHIKEVRIGCSGKGAGTYRNGSFSSAIRNRYWRLYQRAVRVTYDVLEEMVRLNVQEFIQDILEDKISEFLGRGKSERIKGIDKPSNYRNGILPLFKRLTKLPELCVFL